MADAMDDGLSVDIVALKNETTCSICLGVIRNTRTVGECLHRFCAACIEKSLRANLLECPVCRIHVPSRRSLIQDPAFDAVIAAIYGDVDAFEEEELQRAVDINKKNETVWAAERQRMMAISAKRGPGNEFSAPSAGQKRPAPVPSPARPSQPLSAANMHAAAAAALADPGRSSVNVRLKPGKKYISFEQFQSMPWHQRTELFADMYDDLDRPGTRAVFRSHDSAKLRRLLTGWGPPSKPSRTGTAPLQQAAPQHLDAQKRPKVAAPSRPAAGVAGGNPLRTPTPDEVAAATLLSGMFQDGVRGTPPSQSGRTPEEIAADMRLRAPEGGNIIAVTYHRLHKDGSGFVDKSREGGDPLAGVSTMTLERVKPVLPSEAEMVQLELRPHAREPTLPPLPKPYVCCPLNMTVGALSKLVVHMLKRARGSESEQGEGEVDAGSLIWTVGPRDILTLRHDTTLGELCEVYVGHMRISYRSAVNV